MTQENENNQVNINSNDTSIEDTKKEDNKDLKTVPLSEFLEQKKLTKDLKLRLQEFEDKENKIKEQKMLEEKNFQELLETKNLKIKELEDSYNQLVTSNKKERITNTLIRELDKNNAVNSDDVLKLLDVNQFMEEGKNNNEFLKHAVDDLVKNKPYLFNTKNPSRSNTENGQPNSNNNKPNGSYVKHDKATEALINMYKTS